MISKKPQSILIVTHDLKLNRIFTTRYFSFIRVLKKQGHLVKGVGIDFTFKPHPINNLDKTKEHLDIDSDIVTIRPKELNLIQKLLTFSDQYRLPFFLKKYLLALHILVYKTDQWVADISDFNAIDKYQPTIVMAGGGGGIIETAYKLSRKYHAKLILDYRDPWNFGYNLLETNKFANQFKKRFTIKRELELLGIADHIITVSASIKSFFPSQFHHKISIIENGSNFEPRILVDAIVGKPKCFNIVYSGTIYDEQLKDVSFFVALKKFIERNNILKGGTVLKFLGSSKNKLLPGLLKKHFLEEHSIITDRLTQDDVKTHLSNASIFLQLKYDDRSQIITSKQADYLMFRKPILLPNSDHGDIEESIKKYNAGYVCDGKVESIIAVLQKEYNKHLSGVSCTLDEKDLSNLSRNKIAEKLLDIIP